jgi:hypothetical protein
MAASKSSGEGSGVTAFRAATAGPTVAAPAGAGAAGDPAKPKAAIAKTTSARSGIKRRGIVLIVSRRPFAEAVK